LEKSDFSNSAKKSDFLEKSDFSNYGKEIKKIFEKFLKLCKEIRFF